MLYFYVDVKLEVQISHPHSSSLFIAVMVYQFKANQNKRLTSILAVNTGSCVPPEAVALSLSCIRSLISVVPSFRLYAQ